MFSNTFVLSVFVILVSNFSLLAQTPSRDQEKGFIPGVPYAASDTGTINLTNGNLTFSVPLGSLPQGRGSATAGLYLRYNSKLWKKHVEYIPDSNGGATRQTFLGDDADGGWNYGTKYELLITSRNDGLDEPVQVCSQPGGPANLDAIYTTKLQIAFPDGSKREFWPTGASIPSTVHGRYFNIHPNGQTRTLTGGCGVSVSQSTAPYLTYYSVDGSYMNLKVYPNLDWELSTPDGSRITHFASEGQRIYDRNGNYVRFGSVTLPDGSQADGWIDQFERYTARKSNTSPNEDTVYQLGFAGQLLQTKIRWKTVTVIKKYRTECSDCTFTRGQTSDQVAYMTLRVVDRIVSPNGLVSSFDYHAHDGEVAFNPNGGTTSQNWSPGWGEVRSLTVPSTAKTEYDYEIYENSLLQITPTHVLDRSGRATKKTLFYEEEYGGVTTPKQDTWLYTTGKMNGGFVGPDGRSSDQTFFHLDLDEDLGGQVFRTRNSDGTITERQWAFNNPSGFAPGKLVNPYVKAEFLSVPDAAGNPSLTSITAFTYDKNGNVTRTEEYDWVPYSSIPRDESGRVTGIPSTAPPLKKVRKNAYFNSTPTATDASTLSDNAYWRSDAPRLRSLISEAEVQDAAGTPQSRTEMTYDHTSYAGNTKGGNPTSTKMWDSFKGGAPRPYSNPLTSTNSIGTSATYNSYGMPLTATDPRGIVTRITYGNVATPSGNIIDLYPTGTVTAYGTSVARTVSNLFDFHTGLAAKATDVDNNVSATTEYDSLGRPTRVRSAAGTLRERWTRTEYDDLNRRIVVRSDVEAVGDGRKVSIRHYDQLGRERLTRTLENVATEDPYNESHGIKVEMRYGYNDPSPNDPSDPANTLGDYTLVSNPFRAARSTDASNEESMGWSRTYSLRTGRRTEAQTFGGAALPAPWGNNSDSNGLVVTDRDANVTTITDQAGKRIRRLANALGQLVRVDEPTNSGELGSVDVPAQATFYSYDVLGNLVRLGQGVQARDFMYDSLGRLVRVRQPEQITNPVLNTVGHPVNNSWTAGFAYDEIGNLLSSRDARNTVITNAYDPQNRLTSRSYSDSTPAVTYVYDDPAVPFSKGKLTKISSPVSEMRYLVYDESGLLKTSEQLTDGRVYVSRYGYDLAGNLKEQTYPSGRVLKNFLETDGEIGSIASKVSGGPFKNYAANFSYTPSGTIKHLQFGNGLWESAQRNSRNQVTGVSLGNSPTDGSLWKLDYNYGSVDPAGNVDATMNDGNIAKQTIRVAGVQNPFVQSYRYDFLDRIVEAKETVGVAQTWSQAFGYDRYGNRTSFAQNIHGQQLALNNMTLPQIDANTNRFQSGQGYTYDPVGNLISDPQGRRFAFNADNKQVEVRDAQDQVIGEYRYDGNGRRIKKITANETVVFVYDGLGKLVAEMSTAGAAPAPTVNYTATDTLGSPRVLTNSRAQIVSRRDFMPFGEELASDPTYRTANLKYGVADNVRKKFTGYERDDETGLDFAEARYYNGAHGRFTAVDPLLASGKSADPQTFNRYAYSLNRPMVLTDPTGMQTTAGNTGVVPKNVKDLAAEKEANNVDGSVTILPKSMVLLKQKLANTAYLDQAAIARKNKVNKIVGTEQNPATSEVRVDAKQSNSNSSSETTSRSVAVSKDPSVGVGSSSTDAKSSTSEVAAGATVRGPVTNTTGALKDLLSTTDKMISDYVNANADAKGVIKMQVVESDGRIITGSFERKNVVGYLTAYVDSVRTMATCDSSPTETGCQ